MYIAALHLDAMLEWPECAWSLTETKGARSQSAYD